MSTPSIHEAVEQPAPDVGAAAGLSDAPAATDQSPTSPNGAAKPDRGVESRGARVIRMAHRARLHLYAGGTVLLLVYVVALATSNTRRVRVDWVFASSAVPLVWLMLFAAILGWLLGILITILFRLRTRGPHQAATQTTPGSPASRVDQS